VNISTPLLPEVVPETDANPVSFTGVTFGASLANLQNMENGANLPLPLGIKKPIGSQLRGALTLVPWTQMSAPPQNPVI